MQLTGNAGVLRRGLLENPEAINNFARQPVERSQEQTFGKDLDKEVLSDIELYGTSHAKSHRNRCSARLSCGHFTSSSRAFLD
jgi:hypothetical protein